MSLRPARWGPVLASIVFAAAFLGATVVLVVFIHDQQNVDEKLCQVTVTNRASTRSAFESVRTAFLNNIPENEPPAERAESEARINAFIDRVLRPIPPLECVNNQPIPKEG